MTASLWLVAWLACAQAGPLPASDEPAARKADENAPPPRPAASKIVAVTVYQGQALVTREVAVPEGEGTFDLVVTPLPSQAVDASLYTEGAEGLRVLSTRYRSRAVKEDTREAVRAKDDLLARLQGEAERLRSEIAVQEQDLQYIHKLESFTGAALSGLTEKGRLDSDAILALSKFVMTSRGDKSKAEVELRQQVQANQQATALARRQLAELSSGAGRIERDAVIVVHKTRPEAGTVRLGYLVNSARWTPQYRLRGSVENGPVRLEYLAAVTQQTGEPWTDVRLGLSTARPSLDAAPPELLPLKMDVVDAANSGPIEAHDDQSRRIVAELGKVIPMTFPKETSLEDIIKYIRTGTQNATFPDGLPIYVSPRGLQDADKTLASTVTFDVPQVPLKTSLRLILEQLSLVYRVRDGVLTITSAESEADDNDPEGHFGMGMAGMGGGMGGMGGGMGLSIEQSQAVGSARLNQVAATDQAEEMRVAGDGTAAAKAGDKDTPSVAFAVAGTLDIPSRLDPVLVEVDRVELPADFYDKAVPVLTPRVYRLARLTNKWDRVILPGEATVYVGGDFVGRMTLPLVAAGEPFLAGFGVDPQVQLGRRLVNKTRTVQGGNQVFTYEFRIALHNYHAGPVKVQLWDRLPIPEGESVAVNLVKASAELSVDPLYLRTARADNLLRWDLDVPQGATGDKSTTLTYEFRLEYSRDLPQPRFISGGLREGPIGGGAMGGGLGGATGGFRSAAPGRD